MTFSEKLATAMRGKKVSIRELSERTGIPKSAIQRYTSGETDKIPIDRMKLMAEALDIDPAYVMGWSEIKSSLGSDSPAARKLQEIGKQLSLTSASDPDEQELTDIYRRLNPTGRSNLMRQARYLDADPDMRND